MDHLPRIVLAQLNLTVGDLAGNLKKHLHALHEAEKTHQADLLIFPELSLTGYSPEDLLLRPAFIEAAQQTLQTFIEATKSCNTYCIVGHPYRNKKHLYNSCSVIHRGRVVKRYNKRYLPNYGVFDEKRYFHPGNKPCIFTLNRKKIGLMICEDMWHPQPMHALCEAGAKVVITINASPFEVHKHEQRLALLKKRVDKHGVPIVYVNCVGGQDDIIFDGGSMVVSGQGELWQCAGFFNETLTPVLNTQPTHCKIPTEEEKIYRALVLAVRDYVHKNHFEKVYIGVSGGIDSALACTIAVDALGKEKVNAVFMPSRYTAAISNEDGLALAKQLGIKHEMIPIEPLFQASLHSLTEAFNNQPPDVTEENIQARCRAIVLMALANKYKGLVLGTGNRSEIAVGYCTLYGDMAGGFNVLKDVPKTLVYRLSHYRNTLSPVIPVRTLQRPPTAELRTNQQDVDSLPPYDILDRILECYINESKDSAAIIAEGFEEAIVKKVIRLVQKNEYKRKQAPLGPHIYHKSFIRDWRYPTTNGWK